MKTSLLSVLMFFLLTGVQQHERAATSELNGKSFKIKLTLTDGKRAGWQWKTDVLSFASDKVTSREMKAHEGFPPFDYLIDDQGSSVVIHGMVKNRGISKIDWEATIRGDTISGTAIWTNGQGVQTYAFKGVAR